MEADMGFREEDLALLGLTEPVTADEAKARFRELALLLHPDRGGDAAQFDTVRQAHDRVQAELLRPKRCAECRGKGRTPLTVGFNTLHVRCVKCQGTGWRSSVTQQPKET
jgi:DnaJ-class molecular chaperone